MASFSKQSKDILGTCHFELQLLFNYVIQFYDCTVICGYRTKEAQELAFSRGASKKHYPAMHNTKPSVAVDVAPFEKTRVDWDKEQSAHFAGFVMGVASMLYKIKLMKHQIRSGADWDSDNDINDTAFWDACHFELVLLPEETLNYSEK